MAKNKGNTINGNGNIVGDGNNVNQQTTINNTTHNHNGSGGNGDDSKAEIFAYAIGLIVVIFIYVIYHPVTMFLLFSVYFALIVISIVQMIKSKTIFLHKLFIIIISLLFIFHFIPMIKYHFHNLDIPTNLELSKNILHDSWNFFTSLTQNKKDGLMYNFLSTICSFSSCIFLFISLFSNINTRKKQISTAIGIFFMFLVVFLLYYLI